jgi:hypothetical protein
LPALYRYYLSSPLYHGLARLKCATTLCVVDDSDGEAVFNGSQRVKRFQLGMDVLILRRNTIETNDRGVANGFQNIVVGHFFVLSASWLKSEELNVVRLGAISLAKCVHYAVNL